ncbi:LEA type 2 family protein [Methanolobus zinderi]|jgi:LEA14-like dessication related protein|uniref:LEA type 2 family protein n=1 Tax=Methanolobus zinderi TaxID=536044 RepID=A0A7D5EFK4_9EURY|nr:LEA type 2 family protein [Methanolobus zinderi]KXS44673.1 MAG: water stress/hypersensitive response protein [Methanolobus sp. T82-4]QLC50756.1 LEA type 2 family protein [Methanolobus zinderi]
MIKRLIILFIILFVMFMAMGCTSTDTEDQPVDNDTGANQTEQEDMNIEESAQAVRDTELRIRGIEVNEISRDVVDLTLTFAVYNPGDTTVELERMEYDIYANDVRMGEGTFEEPIEIPPDEEIETTTNFVGSVSTAPAAILGAVTEGEVVWTMEGTMFFNTESGTVEQSFSREFQRGEEQ